MTKTASNSVAKLFVAFVTVAMLFTLAAPAKAQTAEATLAEQIAGLMAQIALLEAQLGGTTNVGNASCVSIPAPLTMNAQNANVTALQNFLISAGQVIPAGATGFFGSQTRTALAGWQAANGVSPAVGYYGPITKAAIDAACVVVPTPVTPDEDEDEDDNDSGSSATLGNDEGSIEEFDQVSGDENNLEEGMLGGVLGFELEIEGDVEVDRVDVFAEVDDRDPASDDADDYFVSASLWMDGKMVSEVDVRDFDDDYRGEVANGGTDDEEFRIRFSGLGLVFEDGDMPEFQVAFEMRNSLDSDDLAADWVVVVDELRFTDGKGFTDSVSPAGTISETFGFDAEEVAELDISKSQNNPKATTLKLEADDESKEFEVFSFEIEEENGIDVTIEDLRFTITTLGEVNEAFVVDEAILYMGSRELSSESVPEGGVVDFENLGAKIDGDSTEEFTLALVFKGADVIENAASSVSVALVTTGANAAVRDAEDARGNDEGDMTITGSATSETHLLRTVVPIISDTSFSVDKAENDQSGVISFAFSIEADDDDYLFNVANKAIVNGATDDIRFTLTGTDLTIGATSIILVSGDATPTAAGWTVADGETANFVLDTTFTTVDAADNGIYRVAVDTVGGIDVDKTSAGMSLLR